MKKRVDFNFVNQNNRNSKKDWINHDCGCPHYAQIFHFSCLCSILKTVPVMVERPVLLLCSIIILHNNLNTRTPAKVFYFYSLKCHLIFTKLHFNGYYIEARTIA